MPRRAPHHVSLRCIRPILEHHRSIARAPIVSARSLLLGDRYAVESLIGGGGMAFVYSALDHVTGQRVAIKMLRARALSRDGKRRFSRELRLLSTVEHPNCVRLLDKGEVPAPYAVLEHVPGPDLRDAMRGALPAAGAVGLALQVLRGVQALHVRGILHRDIKPENIMVARRPDGRERAVLVDFGAAISASAAGDADRFDSVTKVGHVLGTPSSMSPEQLRGDPASIRSDLYAVGVLLYEMLTGRMPFRHGDLASALKARLQAPQPLPDTLPPEVIALVRGLLEPIPERRPASCAVALAALERAHAGMLGAGCSVILDLHGHRLPQTSATRGG